MEESKTQKKKRKKSISHYVSGGILTDDFIVKQSRLLILIFILIVFFISYRYSCSKKLTEIERLTTQLKDVKYENLIISTQLTTNSRQSQIEESLEKKGIGLKISKSSIFEIKK
jgi:hypothetical protein